MKRLAAAVYGIFAGLGIAGIIGFWVSVLALFVGYFINIFKLIGMIGTDVSVHLTVFILRIVGLFVGPLGGIMGIFV